MFSDSKIYEYTNKRLNVIVFIYGIIMSCCKSVPKRICAFTGWQYIVSVPHTLRNPSLRSSSFR